MPVHEISRGVHRRRHVHVNNDEVVVAGFGTGVLSSRKFARLAADTLHGSDILQPLVLSKITTTKVSATFTKVSRTLTTPYVLLQYSCCSQFHGSGHQRAYRPEPY